jgi:hypothetical protein
MTGDDAASLTALLRDHGGPLCETTGPPGGIRQSGARRAGDVLWRVVNLFQVQCDGLSEIGERLVDRVTWLATSTSRHCATYQSSSRCTAAVVADVVAFLLSRPASWITGANIVVHGGQRYPSARQFETAGASAKKRGSGFIRFSRPRVR